MFAVFIHHNQVTGDEPAWLASFFATGYMGVTVFFVLSGFVLTVTYADSLAEPNWPGIRNYAVARLARIYPLYILVLLFVLLAGGVLPDGWWLHLLGLQSWSGYVQFAFALNGPGWAVGVEVFLYALFPALLVLLQPMMQTWRRALVLASCAVGALVVSWLIFRVTGGAALPPTDPASAHRWLYRMPAMRLGDFVLGMAAAAVYLNTPREHRSRRWPPLLAALCLLVILGCMATPDFLLTSLSYDLLYAVPAAAMILALTIAPARGIGRLLGSLPVVALGEWSYAFYLIHVPVGARLSRHLIAWGIAETVAVAATLAVLIVMSWAL